MVVDLRLGITKDVLKDASEFVARNVFRSVRSISASFSADTYFAMPVTHDANLLVLEAFRTECSRIHEGHRQISWACLSTSAMIFSSSFSGTRHHAQRGVRSLTLSHVFIHNSKTRCIGQGCITFVSPLLFGGHAEQTLHVAHDCTGMRGRIVTKCSIAYDRRPPKMCLRRGIRAEGQHCSASRNQQLQMLGVRRHA